MKKILLSILALSLAIIVPVRDADAAAMSDYCMTPPFIMGRANPNLLLLIDNSSSMFDLSYIDKGNKPAATILRKPYYCYDETYSSSATYTGYFESNEYYEYDFTNKYFYVPAASFTFPGSCDKIIANQLCINGTPTDVTYFVAKGSYLNWLTASKFDVEKQILTGGKFIEGACSTTLAQNCYIDADCPATETCLGRLLAESRGCVGRSFIKEALTADFVNFTDNPPGTGTDPNTSLGITFGVHGPVDASTPTAVSKGGLTTIDVFVGDYNQQLCQAAVEAFETGASKTTLTNAIGACIGYSATNKNTCQYAPAIICANDAACGYYPGTGTCGAVAPDGICGPLGGGACTPDPLNLGTCTTTPGTCPPSGSINGICVGGSKNGNACDQDSGSNGCGSGTCTRYCTGGSTVCGTNTGSNSALCPSSTACTAGNIGLSPCASHAACDLKVCSSPNPGKKLGSTCVVDADCNSGSCTAGKAAPATCLVNSDCNTGVAHCTAGKPAATECTVNSDCDPVGNGPCLAPADVQIKSTYGQSMHTCYQFTKGTASPPVPGDDEVNQVSNPSGCNQIYMQYMTCLGGSNDGKVCTTLGVNPGECPDAGATCINGPNAIRPGSPVLLCSAAYAGYCANPAGPALDPWSSTTWNAREFPTVDDCIKEKYKEYCNAAEVPPVVDPTESPSDTSNYANLPAILSDIGIGGQLGNRIKQLNVVVKPKTEPRGLLQDYSGLIRMGAMTFNYNGTVSECGTCSNDPAKTCASDNECQFPAPAGTCSGSVQCPKVCSNDAGRICVTGADCVSPGTCTVMVSYPNNLEGGRMVSYIDKDAGSHRTGLVYEVDNIKGESWTPYAEAFYEAIGFFARYQTCSNNASQLCSKDADCSPGTCVAKAYCSNGVAHECVSDNDCKTFFGTDGTCDRYPSRDFRINKVCKENRAIVCDHDSQCTTSSKDRCLDYDIKRNPSSQKCQSNNILLISDGMSTADQKTAVYDLAFLYKYSYCSVTATKGCKTNADCPLGETCSVAGANAVGYDTTNACPKYAGSRDLDDLAWLARNRNIKTLNIVTPASTDLPVNLSEYISTYVVFTGEEDTTLLDQCNPKTLMDNTATSGGTELYHPKNPTDLRDALSEALSAISAKSASGTAASVLASGEGSGANLVQAVFYPSRQFGTTKIAWTGIMQNLWYFIDPQLGNSSIREDSDVDQSLKVLTDCVATYVFDPVTNETKISLLTDNNGDGMGDVHCSRLPAGQDYVTLTDAKYLWEAGKMLFSRAASDRTIYVNLNPDNTTHTLTSFDDTQASGIRPFLNLATALGTPPVNYDNDTNAAAVINYVRGVDSTIATPQSVEGEQTRSRTVTIGTETKPWKLGDIVNSTPKIQSWIPLNLYDKAYGDTTYKQFIDSSTYKNRGMVYSGSNDGILHAFKLGLLGIYQGVDLKASIGTHCSTTTSQACRCAAYPCSAASASPTCPSSETCVMDTDLGKEVWGFIPKNSLPYLKYIANEKYGGCHIYFIDATPFLFDASIVKDASCTATEYWKCPRTVNSWKTVLIGSMRLGGACKNTSATCEDCTKTPVADLGYSSYFALDVTNPASPNLMWEYSHPDLGMSMSGPSIIRINNKTCSLTSATSCNTDSDCPAGESCKGNKNTNGRWFVVLGSGPTGYTTQQQFTGIVSQTRSPVTYPDNPPKLFVLDLYDGSLQTPTPLSPSPASAYFSGFTGSIVNTAIDVDTDYSDDAMYFGYTRSNRMAGFSTDGATNLATLNLASANKLDFNDTVSWTSASLGNSDVNDSYMGRFIEVVDNTAAKTRMTRLITDYDAASRTMTLDSPLPTTSISDTRRLFSGWNDGGVMRVLTNNDLNPANWAVSPVITDIGPVTSAVTKLQNFKDYKLRLYFGTGRYFYKLSDPDGVKTILDDAAGQRNLYGIIDPCFSKTTNGIYTAGCTDVAVAPKNTDATVASDRPVAGDNWYIPLDPAVTGLGAERVLTDPLASTIGAVFFTTNKPSDDVCSYGGVTYLWAVRYDIGASVPAGILKGKAIIQLSTGSITEVPMASAFTERLDQSATPRGRRSGMLQGVPPAGQGLSIIVPPAPIDSILHIRKK